MLKSSPAVFRPEKSGGQNPQQGLFAIQFLLVSIGTVFLFSASWYFSETIFNDAFHIWRRQVLWLILGSIAGCAVYLIPIAYIRRAVPFLVWFALVLNLLTYVPGLGYVAGGARRWIEVFGFTFQPSEFTRIVLILYLARMLEKNRNNLENLQDSLIPPLFVVVVLVTTVYFQNDFSTVAYLLFLALFLFYAAGLAWRALLLLGLSGIFTSIIMLAAKPYRIMRLRSWFNPESDPSGAGYQILRAQTALERGGFWGQGIGQGAMKRGGLPSAHSDFVVAVIGEEWGLFGVVFILFLFTLLAIKGWSIAKDVESSFARWGLFGITTSVYWQVLINFAVVCGVLPATGIPLPLFSVGGSAVFVTLLSFGLMFNFAGDRK